MWGDVLMYWDTGVWEMWDYVFGYGDVWGNVE